MKYIYILVFGLLFGSCKDASREGYIPIAHFLEDNGNNTYNVSPDGTYMSYLKKDGKKAEILYVKKIDNWSEPPIKVNDTISEKDIVETFWSNDNELIYATKAKEMSTLKIFKVASRKKRVIIDSLKYKFAILGRLPELNGIVLTINKRDSVYSDVYNYDAKTHTLVLKIKNNGKIIHWYADHRGLVRAAFSINGNQKEIWVRTSESEIFHKALSFSLEHFFVPVGFDTLQQNVMYAVQNINSNTSSLISFDMLKYKTIKTYYQNSKFDIKRVNFSTYYNKLISVNYDSDLQQTIYFDNQFKKQHLYLKSKLPDFSQITSYGKSDDDQRMIVSAERANDPGAFYFYDAKMKTLKELTTRNENLNADNLAEVSPFHFENKKKQFIQAYITESSRGKKAPMVLVLHRNITDRDRWLFNPMVQFLANRGYTVLQINYSGSWGFGMDFQRCGNRQIGGAIYDDLIETIDWLKENKDINPSKIAIYGQGMAGSIALEAVTKPHQPFCCAISNSGFLNLFSYIKAVSLNNKPVLPLVHERVGNPEKDLQYLKSVSSVFNVHKINVPLYLSYSECDNMGNSAEYRNYIRSLQNLKKDVSYLNNFAWGQIADVYTYEMAFYTKFEKFLEKNLKN